MRQILPNELDQIADICTKMLTDYAQFAKNHHLNENELGILYTLWVDGACNQSHIADKCLIAKQTVNTLCQKFIADGLLVSQTSEYDKRQKVLYFTDKGQDFAKPVMTELLQKENQAIAAFGHQRVNVLLSEFKELQIVLAKHLEQKSG